MPEATILYSVTGVVVAGLVAWVVMVLNKAKEPWVRPPPAEEPASEEEGPPAAAIAPVAAGSDADDTARQTPVALSTGRAKAADDKGDVEKAIEEAKAEKAEEPAFPAAPADEPAKEEEKKSEA